MKKFFKTGEEVIVIAALTTILCFCFGRPHAAVWAAPSLSVLYLIAKVCE